MGRLQQGNKVAQRLAQQSPNLLVVKAEIGNVHHRDGGIPIGWIGKEDQCRAEPPVKVAAVEVILPIAEGGKEGAGPGRSLGAGGPMAVDLGLVRIIVPHRVEGIVPNLFETAQRRHLAGREPVGQGRGG